MPIDLPRARPEPAGYLTGMTEPVRVRQLLIPQEWSALPDLRVHVVHSADFTYLQLRGGSGVTPLVELAIGRSEAVRLGAAIVEGTPLGD